MFENDNAARECRSMTNHTLTRHILVPNRQTHIT